MTYQVQTAVRIQTRWQQEAAGISSGGGAMFAHAMLAMSGTWGASAATGAQGVRPGQAGAVQGASLEDMLRQAHPRLTYHVFDATSPNWKRNDFPHYLLYQQDVDTSRIENWQPRGEEPDQLRCPATKALLGVPEGSVAVVIHPRCQQAMEQDPEYARQIYERIEAWFTFDELRNAAALGGGGSGISCRSIAIGEDGEIANVQAFGGGPSGPRGARAAADEDEHGKLSWWDKRALRHAKYMKEWTERQLEHARLMSDQLTQMSVEADVKMRLRSLLSQKDLLSKLGDTVAGAETAKVLEVTAQAVFGSSLPTLIG